MIRETITDKSGINFYKRKNYDDKCRWVSYFWQTGLVKALINQGSVLVIGIGNNLAADYLKSLYEVKTVDIDKDLNPDYLGSVDNLSFLSVERFDVVLCAEVLEHLPFEKFLTSLNELKRVANKHIVISLPYWGYTFGFKLKSPVLGTKIFKFKISQLKSHQLSGPHFWEIGKRGYSLRKIRQAIIAAGLTMEKSFWDIDDPYHYYFVLKK